MPTSKNFLRTQNYMLSFGPNRLRWPLARDSSISSPQRVVLRRSNKHKAVVILCMAMATTTPWNPLLHSNTRRLYHPHRQSIPRPSAPARAIRAFKRSDFEDFAERVGSGEVWRDTWRTANDSFERFELFIYETKKTAERIDRRYSVSRRLSEAAQSASYRARELDRDLAVTQRWRTLSLDFRQNWPKYRKQLNDFFNTTLGKSIVTVFFVWFALSGWLFQFLIFATFATPLLLGTVANNLVIQGDCPSCKTQFMGYKNQIIRCSSCGNIVWQRQGDFFSKGRGSSTPSSKSEPEVIDVDFEEK